MTKVELKKIFYMDHLIHTRKTYMDYMRNELNIVILYDRSAKTYYYGDKGLYDSLKQWIA